MNEKEIIEKHIADLQEVLRRYEQMVKKHNHEKDECVDDKCLLDFMQERIIDTVNKHNKIINGYFLTNDLKQEVELMRSGTKPRRLTSYDIKQLLEYLEQNILDFEDHSLSGVHYTLQKMLPIAEEEDSNY